MREEIRSNLRVRFVVDSDPGVIDYTKRNGFETMQRTDDVAVAVKNLRRSWEADPPRLFILDSVDQDRIPEMRSLLADDRMKTFAVIDDIDDREVPADLTLNALPGESIDWKKSSAGGGRIRELKYLIQDIELAEFHAKSRDVPNIARRGFAFFGGSDMNDFTNVFFDAIEPDAGMEWSLLIGEILVDSKKTALRRRAEKLSVHVIEKIPSVAEELWRADIALLAGGNVVSEAAAVGTPCITMSQLDVQAVNAKFYADTVGTIDLGGAGAGFPHPHPVGYRRFADPQIARHQVRRAIANLFGDAARRAAMRSRMLAAVDGRGAERVAKILRELLGSGTAR